LFYVIQVIGDTKLKKIKKNV